MSETSTLDMPARASNGEQSIDDAGASLIKLCNEFIYLVTTANSLNGPYNQAEAAQFSEAQARAAHHEQNVIIDRLERLVEIMTNRSAVSFDEVVAKRRAFDVLTSLVSWDSAALLAFNASMD